ncbi:MAG: ABC transporter permease [Castellaniella sp.]|nr:ABC transporter permease [Castellaniella sp.]
MTTSADLRALTVAALQNATPAGANVFSPRTWDTWAGSYPAIIVSATQEDGASFGRNGPPAFTVTATIHVSARIHVAGAQGNQDAAAAQVLLEQYREQIKAAVINYPPLMSVLQHYPFFRSALDISSDGERPIGQVDVAIGMEFVQGPEDFYPVPVVPLQGVDVQITEPNGTPIPGATIDLPQS